MQVIDCLFSIASSIIGKDSSSFTLLVTTLFFEDIYTRHFPF